jgi:hypothetical protein
MTRDARVGARAVCERRPPAYVRVHVVVPAAHLHAALGGTRPWLHLRGIGAGERRPHMFDVSNHVEDVRYGIQHCDFSKSPNSTMLASVLRMGVVVDRDPGIAASQRVVALGNRSTVEPAQLDLVFITLDKHLRVDVQDHLLQVAVLLQRNGANDFRRRPPRWRSSPRSSART